MDDDAEVRPSSSADLREEVKSLSAELADANEEVSDLACELAEERELVQTVWQAIREHREAVLPFSTDDELDVRLWSVVPGLVEEE